jgi:hypothetical protein
MIGIKNMAKTVEVSAELKSEIMERIRIYTEVPEQVIDPDYPESQEDFNELVAYLNKLEDNTLDVELCETFVSDFEASLRSYGEAKGKIYRSLCKFYVDSGLAVPVDTQAFREGREWCSGGLKGATWFTYNQVRYQSK